MTKHAGDQLCDRCIALFWAAQVLFDEGISAESEVIPTMAFAWYLSSAEASEEEVWAIEFAKQLARLYRGLGLVKVVSGVPILRVEPAVVWPVRYDGIELLKEIRIELFSRAARSADVAEQYELVLLQEGMPWENCTSGKVSWNFVLPHLMIDVGLADALEPGRAERMSKNPAIPRPSFPHPSYISNQCKLLLRLYGGALDRYGRSQPMTPEAPGFTSSTWR